jgi:hypothetical protein
LFLIGYKNDITVMREERKQDKAEAKKDMAIMKEEMQRNFFLTSSISVAGVVAPFILSKINNNANNNTLTK